MLNKSDVVVVGAVAITVTVVAAILLPNNPPNRPDVGVCCGTEVAFTILPNKSPNTLAGV
jgi:hypothetical protein